MMTLSTLRFWSIPKKWSCRNRPPKEQLLSLDCATQMQPTHIYHADWGTDPSKRWLARAKFGAERRYIAEAARPVGDHKHLITSIRSEIGSQGCALVGFDFPIGVPEPYASAARIEEFKSLLLELGTGAWADFFTVSRIAADISIHAPSILSDPEERNRRTC